MSSWVRTAMAALIALTLAAGAAASAQPALQDFLTQQLDSREPQNSDEGYARAAGPLAGWLASERAARLPLTLRRGQDIRIVGVCDQNCRDLDLRLLSPRNQLVVADVDDDNNPVLDVSADMFGQHVIEVGMIDCDAPRCRYAVNVYTR